MSVVANNIIAGASGQGSSSYEIERSLRFNSSDSAYLKRTPSSSGNRRTWTWSGWVKVTNSSEANIFTGGTSSSNDFAIRIDSGVLSVQEYSGSWAWRIKPNALLRDPSAFYHICVSFDSTQVTSSDRIKIYINGVQQTSFSALAYPSQNFESLVSKNNAHYFGYSPAYSYSSFNLAETYFIDGQRLLPTAFGEFDDNNVWQAKEYEGTYGPNQSETWSGNASFTSGSLSSGSQTNAFDGNPTTVVTGSANGTWQVTFDTALDGEVVVYNTQSSTTRVWHVYEGSTDNAVSASASPGSQSLGTFSNITKITQTSSGGWGTSISQIRVGGAILVDPSASIADNSFYFNFSDNNYSSRLGTDKSGLGLTLPSVEFDGNDHVHLPAGSDFAFGTGDFTVEAFVRHDSRGNNDYIIDARNSSQTTGTWSLAYGYTSGSLLQFATGSTALLTASSNPPVGKWFHVAVTRSGTSLKMFIDGKQVASATDSTDFSTSPSTSYIATRYSSQNYMTGNISNLRVVKGTAVYTSEFTVPTTPLANITNTKLLCFQTATTAANVSTDRAVAAVSPGTLSMGGNPRAEYKGDRSFEVYNLSVTSGADNDSLVDTPTNYGNDTGAGGEVRGNYATFNPLSIKRNSGTMENGNLTLKASGSHYIEGKSTIDVFSVDNYSELTVTAAGSASLAFGIGDIDAWVISGGGSYVVYRENGAIISYPGNTTLGTVSSYTQGDVLGMAVDDTNVKFYKNGSLQGTYAHGKSGTFFVIAMNVPNSGTTQLDVNFGQRAFAYTAPSGYKCLNTASLPTPAIKDSSKYFDTKLWTGTSASKNITGYNFSPDFVWIKNRGGFHHALLDTVRGTNKVLSSSQTVAEATYTQSLTSFNSDGFTLGDNSDSNNLVNINANNYVGWAWDGGSSTVSNTDGDDTSSVRASQVSGFSIVTYTGNDTTGAGVQTVGHGLNSAPEMYIVKSKGSGSWFVYHKEIGNTKYLSLDSTAAEATSVIWNNTSPTSTVFSVRGGAANTNNQAFSALCFTSVVGYSKVGSYTGNGSADSPFVFLGFRPAFLIIKSTAGSTYWTIFDSSRDPDNIMGQKLYANSSSAEGTVTSNTLDFLSNGFKVRSTSGDFNTNNTTYIYYAVAENPFSLNGGLAR